MSEILCPICNRPNDENAERCWYCQAVLHPDDSPAAGDSANWLDGLRIDGNSSAPETPSQESDIPVEKNEEDVPDWLARIRERAQAEKSGQEEEPESADFDWLKQIQSGDEPVPSDTEKTPQNTPADESNNDDWLKQLESWQDEPAASQPEEPTNQLSSSETEKTSQTDNNLNDWLKDLAAQPTEQNNEAASTEALPGSLFSDFSSDEKESKSPDAEEPPAEEPNWLSSFKKLPEEGNIADLVIPPPQEDSTEKSAFNSQAVDDWLSAQDKPVIPAAEEHTASEPEPEETANLSPSISRPSDDQNLKPENSSINSNPFGDSSSMDWMESEPLVSEAQTGADGSSKNLEPAALPAWLQALRPGHKNLNPTPSVTPKVPAHREDRGPLAGIEGVLQGEELNQYYSKPQTYNGSLTITDSQMARSKLLKNIADQGQWVDEEFGKPARSYRWVLRLIVAVLMLLAVLIPIFIKDLPNVTPSFYSEEVLRTFNTVNEIPTGKAVLVAADFDSSLYGEMNWVMQPLLTHLMSRNIPIAYLSTNSVGATLMNQSLAQIAKDNPAYAPDQLIDFGYLAGGSIAMQSLAQDPQTTLKYTVEIASPWESDPLKSVKKLSDFGSIIVITENPDTARYWIEQVRSAIGDTPLLVVSSAQAAPLVQPYYDSGQIEGFLSGTNSAIAYSALIDQTLSAQSHLTSYQAVLLLVILIILVGGIVSLITYRPADPNKKGK